MHVFVLHCLLTLSPDEYHVLDFVSMEKQCENISECSFWNRNKWDTSDKKIIKRLKELCKHVWDSNLHSQIWKKEVLPNENTIDFKVEFDFLLKHIILELHK